MKAIFLTLITLTSIQASANEWLASCNADKNVTILQKKDQLFRIEISEKDGSPSEDFWGERKVLLSSDANVSLVNKGMLKGCFAFTSTKSDISSLPQKYPLWTMFACLSQDKKDIIFFDGGDQFQPSDNVHSCTKGLFKKLKYKIR